MKSVLQGIRLVGMVLAVAGIIYAVEYVPSGIAVWFWVVLLGIGFVGLLYSFRVAQRRNRRDKGRAASRRQVKRRR